MSQQQPISIQSPLSGNPKAEPLFGSSVSLMSGESLTISDPRALRAMVSLMDMQAVLGGAASHWGGPSAFAELVSSIYGYVFNQGLKNKKEWHEDFHVVNDAGHCENVIYALKANYGFADLTLQSLRGFRSISSSLTGHGESHLFPEGVLLSNGPLGSSVAQAQGLAMADQLAGKSRVTLLTVSDGASMEGEAKEAFAAIPGLANKGKLAPFVMVLSDNNTKLSGRIDEQSFSMKNTFQCFKQLGWEVLELQEGHDLQKCANTIENVIVRARQNPKKPVVVWAHTIKGYGVESTEKSASGGHGFPIKDARDLEGFIKEIYKGADVPEEFTSWTKELVELQDKKNQAKAGKPAVKKEKVQVGVAKALIQAKKAGLPLISVTSDLPGSTGLAAFQKEYPDSFIDVGVAESNMVSAAAGYSKMGYIPIVDTFSQFGATKGALPFIMSSLSQAPMVAIFSHAGFQDAADGASHQALNYFSILSSIPHIKVYSLATSQDAEVLVGQALEEFKTLREQGKTPSSYVFFLGRETFVPSVSETEPKLDEAQVVLDNSSKHKKSVTVVASGPLLHQALLASQALEEKGVGSIVINPLIINNPDTDKVKKALEKSEGRLVTVEDHQLVAGMGSMLCHKLTSEGCALKLRSLGVRGEFGQSAYSALELYQKHGLDSASIVKAANELL